MAMNRRTKTSSHRGSVRATALLLVLSLPVLVSCETSIGGVRATSFPPDLTYIPEERLQMAMWVLAAEIQELERILSLREQVETESQRVTVMAILERMRVAARTLEEPGRSTQHPVLNENLDVFINRLDRAKRALDRQPPDFFPSSTIAGSCYLCHGQTKAMAIEKRKPVIAGG
jgi:hypothetical protein